VDLPRSVGRLDDQLQPHTDPLPVAPLALEVNRDVVIAMAGIHEQRVVEGVARIEAAELVVDVLIAVDVQSS